MPNLYDAKRNNLFLISSKQERIGDNLQKFPLEVVIKGSFLVTFRSWPVRKKED